ncbi:SR protein kinase, partial [Rhexocercosporidium sp. MPI-PUGE-AT-0058]
VVRKLGQGQYSTVWLATDSLLRKYVALKILRADRYGTANDVFKLEMLKKISEPANRQLPEAGQVTRLLNVFKHSGPNGEHVCFVFDVLGHHIGYEARLYGQRRIPAKVMREVIRQILLGLDFLHRQCGIIQIDLKPSNILIGLEIHTRVLLNT